MTAISRRTALTGALGLVGGALLGTAGGCASPSRDQTARLLTSTAQLPERFTVPFELPPVKQPVSRRAGVLAYEIVQRRAMVEILPGRQTEVLGYDGLLPGPTIVARRGEAVTVTHRNELYVPTVVHLHGGHTAAASDGYPTDLLLPVTSPTGHRPTRHGHASGGTGGVVAEGSRPYVYGNNQPAATLWYHDHRMDFTGPQVWRGLAGLYLITDEAEDALGLPTGDRDLPLLIMDRAFAADGSLAYPSLDPRLLETPGVRDPYTAGVLGDVVLVNGRPWPELAVDAARYRLRIVNGSNARRYRLGLSPAPTGDAPPFLQVGSDGGLLAAPRRHTEILVAPAERFDVIVDFSAYPVGTEVLLTNALGLGSTDAVMRFRVARSVRDDSRVPERLARWEPLETSADTPVREWSFTRGGAGGPAHWVINGRAFDPDRMDARPRLSQTEIWRFSSDLHHPVHVHLSPFQVLRRGSGGPGRWDAGWKDTVDLTPTETVEVAIRFTGHTGRYMLHCHNLEHEDMMMMAAFETVA
jgi:spore coat protein A